MFAAKLHIGVAIDEKRREGVMRNYHAIALSLLCGVGIGAAGVEGLRAQAKPPIYMIGNNDVSDADGYMREYLPFRHWHQLRDLRGDRHVRRCGAL